ncbi:MAG: sensor histidine kinase N-terminal domain-containing protein [Xanthomonadales bacterium]|nr:sensor histidine kinase N-terminal domain-containing protein [Xanthomonadales bacterium]MBK7146538.1 sensor histidine kinase N-terminal domain-containing protein [Xanthomonadales bacterium]MCC6563100.1 sensor histidine kinase N-terminal domain-containing protein [Xanthomonadales bacterium]
MSLRRPSLQRRLLGRVLAAVAGLWLAAAALTWFDTRHELEELLDGHLAQAASALLAQRHGDDDDRPVEARPLHRYASAVAFQVFRNGRLALRSADAPRQQLVAGDIGEGGRFHDVRIDGAAWRVFVARSARRDVVVQVGERSSARNAILWAALHNTLWPLLWSLPLLALVVWWAVARAIAPLHRLGRALAGREPQALEPLALDDADRELLPLVEALNHLFARIEALLGAERRFTADAAHELRTPIAAIRAQAQVALGAADDGQRRHALGATIAACDRAARLVEQLLTLSRIESSGPLQLSAVELEAVARGVLGELAAATVAQQRSLSLDAEAEVRCRADALLLGVLIRNLVDNALRYGREGGRVEVALRRCGEHFELRVDDDGPGLDAAQRQRLGERFFRVLGRSPEGSGLGWSIVRRIADAHGFEIAVDRSALGGLQVRLTGPLLRAS